MERQCVDVLMGLFLHRPRVGAGASDFDEGLEGAGTETEAE
ncbi:hypothetical protein [Natrinema pallidum]|nr:hypothetical protein [Natrinema pallidum]